MGTYRIVGPLFRFVLLIILFGVRKDNMVATVPMENMKMDMKISMEMDMSEVRPQWQSITLSALHCGAGCTLADIIGEWFTYWVPLQIGGSLIAR